MAWISLLAVEHEPQKSHVQHQFLLKGNRRNRVVVYSPGH